jgi:hypothetical protein
VLLVTEATETDDPSVFGQEAHIISEAPGGPRSDDLPDHDAYANLILLCANNHKPADDQQGHYTPERLRQIKRDHEAWIATLGEGSGPVRLVPDPTRPAASRLRVYMTGSSLWNFVRDSHQTRSSWPEGLSEEHEDLIAGFLEAVNDWRDVDTLNGSQMVGRDAARNLSGYIRDLTEAGFLIGARERFCLLTGGTQEPSSWRIIDIQIQPLGIAQVVDESGSVVWPAQASR